MKQIPADNGGWRDNAGKMARYDLIPPEALEALAIHYGQGATKYEDRNWERGMDWSKSFASLMRHTWAWFRGESYDKEDPKMPGYQAHHLISAAWNAFTAYTYEMRRIGIDNRPAGAALSAPKTEATNVTTTVGGMTPGQASFMWGEPNPPIHPPVMEPGWDVVWDDNAAPPPPPPNKPPFTFWYVATPYSHYPHGHIMAFGLAARVTAELLLNGVRAFSPIAHSHPLVQYMPHEKAIDHEFWMDADAPFMDAASGLIVVGEEGWERSRGIAAEINRFMAAGKTVVYWAPINPIPKTVMETAYDRVRETAS